MEDTKQCKRKFDRSKFNIAIDIVMLVVLMIIAGIGFIMKYVLVPGFKRNEIYGVNTDLYFWGLDRHQWGTLHLIFSFFLLFLLILHIIFHWKMITCLVKKLIPNSFARQLTFLSLVVIIFVFGLSPFFIQPVVKISDEPRYRRSTKNNIEITQTKDTISKSKKVEDLQQKTKSKPKLKNDNRKHQHQLRDEVKIYGYMSLSEVAIKYSIPVSDLAAVINIPVEYQDRRLGRLRKQYDFHMNDLRQYIENNTSKK